VVFFEALESVWLCPPDGEDQASKFTPLTRNAITASKARERLLELRVMEFPPTATAHSLCLAATFLACLAGAGNNQWIVAGVPCQNAGMMAKNAEQVKMEEVQFRWPNGQ
jgi:hypothetical protein